MNFIAPVAVALVAGLHLYILVLEMFLWTTPFGMKTFGLTPDRAAITKVLAANQGLYNGFLSAGLIWALTLGDAGRTIAVFFLGCVVAAGVFGALTASRKILIVQGVPGAVALAVVLAT